MKPLIVGEAPSRTSDPATPIAGVCGRRLAGLAGLPFTAFLDLFERANVLGAWPGPAPPKGAAFPAVAARARAEELMRRRFVDGRTVLLLGLRTASAFGVRPEYFARQSVLDATVFVVPHPSGVNRWFNDPENLWRLGRFMRKVVRDERRRQARSRRPDDAGRQVAVRRRCDGRVRRHATAKHSAVRRDADGGLSGRSPVRQAKH